MPYELETEVRGALEEIRDSAGADIRQMMAGRKFENLNKHEPALRAVERRVLGLLRRVDYADIQPTLIAVRPSDVPVWTYCRHILSSAPWYGRPGRLIRYLVVDRNTGGIMGIAELGSDMGQMAARDQMIGWSKDVKFHEGGLNKLANLGTCVGTTPFGRLTGGKFIAMAVLSNEIVAGWNSRYASILGGVVTTSLFGKSSQYNRIPPWELIGYTAGVGAFQISQRHRRLFLEFIKRNPGDVSFQGTGGQRRRGVSDRRELIASKLGMKGEEFTSNQPRGVYFAPAGESAMAFLRGEVDDPRYQDRSMASVAEWWLGRWYSMRFPKLVDEVTRWDPDQYAFDEQMVMLRRAKATV